MTEKEIIQILKDNKEKGIAFGFLPDEVITFALKYKKRLKLLDKEGFWISYYLDEDSEISIHEVVCLPEDFELKNKSEGEWVEFNIKDGVFYEAEMGVCYKWYEWSCFIAKNTSYEAFGGWLYDKSGDWVLSPQVGLIDDSGNAPFILNRYTYSYEKERIIPVFPIKIRFWKNVK